MRYDSIYMSLDAKELISAFDWHCDIEKNRFRFFFFLRRRGRTENSDCHLRHVCASVRIKQLGSQWKDFFNEILYSSIFRKNKICRE